jgi:hypothetical protein
MRELKLGVQSREPREWEYKGVQNRIRDGHGKLVVEEELQVVL